APADSRPGGAPRGHRRRGLRAHRPRVPVGLTIRSGDPTSPHRYRGPMGDTDVKGVGLRWLAFGDDELLMQASDLFDEPVQRGWVARFLAQAGHHLCLAMVD